MAAAIPEFVGPNQLWTTQNLEPQAADGGLVFPVVNPWDPEPLAANGDPLVSILSSWSFQNQLALGDLVFNIEDLPDCELLNTDNIDPVSFFPDSRDFLESKVGNGCVESPITDPWDTEPITADGGHVVYIVNSWLEATESQAANGIRFLKFLDPTVNTKYEISDDSGNDYVHKAFKAFFGHFNGLTMMPRRFGSFIINRDSYLPLPEPVKNDETQGGVGYLVVPIPNNGNHMVKQVNDHQEATKLTFKDGGVTMLMLTMIFTFMAALMSASIENPHQASIATRSFLWCNSAAFVASLAGVIYLLHEFPLKPWSHITVSLLFIPYMLLAFKISPDDAFPLLFLSIPILLLAAARELCGLPTKALCYRPGNH